MKRAIRIYKFVWIGRHNNSFPKIKLEWKLVKNAVRMEIVLFFCGMRRVRAWVVSVKTSWLWSLLISGKRYQDVSDDVFLILEDKPFRNLTGFKKFWEGNFTRSYLRKFRQHYWDYLRIIEERFMHDFDCDFPVVFDWNWFESLDICWLKDFLLCIWAEIFVEVSTFLAQA